MGELSKTQLAVIGAGPGGYAAAFLGSDLGMQVTLIDPQPNPGGVCLYRGCIPSKALLHVARLLNETKHAQDVGVRFGEPSIDLHKLRTWKEGVIEKLTGGLGRLCTQRKVRYLQGRATIVDGHTLKVRGETEEQILAFDHAIVATGSQAARLPVFPADSPRVMGAAAALALPDIPKRLLVVGGGYIGLELGSAYAAFGSRVTVVELLPTLLPGVDSDLVRPLRRRLETQFEEILVETKVVDCQDTGSCVKVRLEGSKLHETEREYDRVLVSVGRKPTTEGLGLEKTKAELDDAGFINVDLQRRTAEPSLFAIGDVAGQPMLAHKAAHEGRTAVEVIAGGSASFAPRAIPAVVFTDPEIAWCGLTEAEAKRSGRKVSVVRYPWAASGRALTMNRSEGLTKLLVNPDNERVLGVGICGVGAGELIGEAALALEMEADAKDLGLTIHPHPTLSETLMEAADAFFGQSAHVYRPRGK